MPRAMLAAVAGVCAVAAGLAVVLAVGLFWLRAEDRPAVALVSPSPIPSMPHAFVNSSVAPRPTQPTKSETPALAEKKTEVATAPVPKPIAAPKPAAPRAKVVEDPFVGWKKTLLDPAASMEKRQAAVAQLARTEAGAMFLLQLTEGGRLSAGLQQFAMDRLYQNAAALAGGIAFSP